MEDIELYEAWCEYNNNNLPISFTEFVYEQGRADAIEECCKQISERVKYWDNCAKAVEKGSNEYKIFISLAKNFDELQEQLKESEE